MMTDPTPPTEDPTDPPLPLEDPQPTDPPTDEPLPAPPQQQDGALIFLADDGTVSISGLTTENTFRVTMALHAYLEVHQLSLRETLEVNGLMNRLAGFLSLVQQT